MEIKNFCESKFTNFCVLILPIEKIIQGVYLRQGKKMDTAHNKARVLSAGTNQ